MLSNGNAAEYKHLSKHKNTDHLNKSIRGFLYKYKHDLNDTVISLYRLIANHSVKFTGICFMKYSTIAKQIDKSESTVKRSLKVLNDLGAIEVHRTTRTSGKIRGGFGHNVFVLCDLSSELSEVNHRKEALNSNDFNDERLKAEQEASNSEPSNLLDKRSSKYVDHDYLPSYIDQSFIDSAKPFFNAEDIHRLWTKVKICHKKEAMPLPLENYADLVSKTLRQVVFQYKNGNVHNLFGYFYGGMREVFKAEVKRSVLRYDYIGNGA